MRVVRRRGWAGGAYAIKHRHRATFMKCKFDLAADSVASRGLGYHLRDVASGGVK